MEGLGAYHVVAIETWLHRINDLFRQYTHLAAYGATDCSSNRIKGLNTIKTKMALATADSAFVTSPLIVTFSLP